ncbi:MAG: hypothetical protein CBC39_06615 [Cellvibrionales bacterium TMED79]|nr:hypothetical protein [Halieaceae bacterium]OUV00281.1 MAG: hypothetical protein CBC39_06615 [Cellvibrionales bacterium TMED79]
MNDTWQARRYRDVFFLGRVGESAAPLVCFLNRFSAGYARALSPSLRSLQQLLFERIFVDHAP